MKKEAISPVADAICTACGEPLGGRASCLACLLRGGLDEHPARFGDFEISRGEDGRMCELGRGATGVTYRAHDAVLHRDVALKVIETPALKGESKALRERFLREARAAAALRHANVAAVFHFNAAPEADRCYCAMELVEGETLDARVRRDGPLNVELALTIAIQVTRALVAAADRGLVHRDLKPGNIMLAAGGDGADTSVKVIDFGLAKAASAAGEMELTHGAFVGTPAFASPEQFSGAAVDARTDIYALGVTLWFMLTGRLPFGGTTINAIREGQAHHPVPADQLRAKAVPARVIDVVRSCLALAPTERPASAGELLQLLEACRARPRRRLVAIATLIVILCAIGAFVAWRVRPEMAAASPPAPSGKSLAVLPFEDRSNDAADRFFAEGIQDDVTTSVAKIRDVKVVARGSVTDYRNAASGGKLREIGRALRVTHLLTGSVRRANDRVVVNVALIDTRDARQVWSERYERTLTNTLSLQGELAVEIARALDATLTPAEQTVAAAKPTQNSAAYLLYLRAREIDVRPSDLAETMQSAELYRQAIKLDPAFAIARARLSITATQISQWPRPDASEWKTTARREAEEALRLQPDLGEASLAMTNYLLYVENDDVGATGQLARAAELLPNSAEVPLTAAFIYKRQNRFRDRLAALRRAEALDPRNSRVIAFVIVTSQWVRDWTEALHALERYDVVRAGGDPRDRAWARANCEFEHTGDITVLAKAVADLGAAGSAAPSWLPGVGYDVAMLKRDYGSAVRFLAGNAADSLVSGAEDDAHLKVFDEALLAVASNADAVVTQQLLGNAETALQVRLSSATEPLVASHLSGSLALIHAFEGQKEAAVREATRGIDVLDARSSTIERNDAASALALVYARTGETERAIDLIAHLLTVPSALERGAVHKMTLQHLKWSWVWDPLRTNPRFQKLIAGPEPVTLY